MDLNEIIENILTTTGGLHILETGTIRGEGEQYRIGDGWSTVAFAEHVRDHGGSVTSIDLDVSTARKVLEEQDLDGYVTLIEGHSIQALSRLLAADSRHDLVGFDVILLDSDNDPQLILHEYLIAAQMLRRPGVLIVDDVDLESEMIMKGHQVVPWLDREGVPYEIVQREAGGYTTGVLIARFKAARCSS